MLVRVPESVDLEIAAASMLQGMTAHYLVHDTYRLAAGDTALVHGAAGGGPSPAASMRWPCWAR